MRLKQKESDDQEDATSDAIVSGRDPKQAFFKSLIDRLIFQATFNYRFGNGQGGEFSVNPGAMTQDMYNSNTDNDPFGQSYYDQGITNNSSAIHYQQPINTNLITQILNRFRNAATERKLSL